LRLFLVFILAIILTCSCKKTDTLDEYDYSPVRKDDILNDYPPGISFNITGRLMKGKHIDCIEPDYNGNIWIASDKELYYKNGNDEKTYTLDFPVLDISIAGDETLWIGTKEGGLGHLSKTVFLYWNNKKDLLILYVLIFSLASLNINYKKIFVI
jgi:ligand-binding sensor domain-containing protein